MNMIQSYVTSSPLSKFFESIVYSMEARDIEKEKNEKRRQGDCRQNRCI